jgi:2-iminobutanoate/2-iminopropanoate deaminase
MALERYDPFDGALGFSLAVASGTIVHVSGMVGLDPETLTVPSDLESQMRIAYRSVAEALTQFGCTLADVADQTVFFVGDHEAAVAAADTVRHDLFRDGLPASAMVGVDKLVDPRFLVEVKVTAYRSDGRGAPA